MLKGFGQICEVRSGFHSGVRTFPIASPFATVPLDRTLGAGAESSGGSQDCNALVLTTEATISVFSSALGVLLGEALEVLSEVDPSRVDMFCNPEW